MDDSVNHPKHYTGVVPGVECIEVTKHFSFLRGNAIKYLWRAGAKGDVLEDLRKAMWYIQCEIDTIQSDNPPPRVFKEGDRVVIRAAGPQQGRLAVVCDVTGWSGKVLVRFLSGNAKMPPVRLVEPHDLGYVGSE